VCVGHMQQAEEKCPYSCRPARVTGNSRSKNHTPSPGQQQMYWM